MKLSFLIVTSFLAGAADSARNMLRRKGGDDASPPAHHDGDRRKLTHKDDINSGTPVKNLCNYIGVFGQPETLPVTVTDAEPDKIFKIEKASGITFTFSLCGAIESSSILSSISIWAGFDQGDEKHLAIDWLSCGGQAELSWTAPDDSVYYVRFGAKNERSYIADATWYTDSAWLSCFINL